MNACGLHCLNIANIGVKTEGRTLLENVGLHVHCGQLTAIIGPNGAGKTTLLRAILDEIPHTGTVAFSGHNGTPIVGGKPRIGYVPQTLSVDRNTPATVYDLLLSLTGKYPVFFRKNRVFRVYQGGKLLDAFIGEEGSDGNYPEEWICSAVRAINPGHTDPLEGISLRDEDGMPFDVLLREHKEIS